MKAERGRGERVHRGGMRVRRIGRRSMGGIEGQARAGRRLYRRCIHDRVVFCPCKGSGIRWGWRRGGLIGRWEGVRRANRTLLTIEELRCLAIIEEGREMEDDGEADGDH